MLERLCNNYSKKVNPKIVILFGSRARGDYTNESDIDVLVVSDALPKDSREGFGILFDPNEPEVEPAAMNTEVFMRKLKNGSTFILEVIEDGKILCGMIIS
ncbi:nucleotidyltransferase domain-containing protein [Sulfuracidifex tepidarius]|uniref:nucleotidyltransferase domain-containing protein n=1 Tax=Sulfuracidifex tepidarius TaxID=1294262 RepID=UPI000A9B4251|nr:nucleotidyltransferase domain-containing protein [Sulfuracidifex tepidarius]